MLHSEILYARICAGFQWNKCDEILDFVRIQIQKSYSSESELRLMWPINRTLETRKNRINMDHVKTGERPLPMRSKVVAAQRNEGALRVLMLDTQAGFTSKLWSVAVV